MTHHESNLHAGNEIYFQAELNSQSWSGRSCTSQGIVSSAAEETAGNPFRAVEAPGWIGGIPNIMTSVFVTAVVSVAFTTTTTLPPPSPVSPLYQQVILKA
jgi:hypothetical protein